MRVSIRVLGALDVRIDDTAVDVGGPTQQALVALLASTVDAPMPADEIASALWGARLPARHRQQVQKRVHMLRATLGAEAVTTDGDGYRLSCRTDLHEFTHRLSHARALRAGQDLAEAADAYRSALALWRGPALDGLSRLPELAARLDDLRGQATSEHQELGRLGSAALPPQPRTFVGRTDALAALTGPLSVIIGPPGVGKTALAVRWAHRADFPDGKLFLNLHGFGTESPMAPDEALRRLLRALGVDRGPRTLDDQVALYRSLLAGKRVLVVLDNAASEDQVRPLLPADPRCAAVVTSRNDLRGLVALNDAHRLALDVLNEAEACALVESLTGSGENAAELARLCGYLPLALRVAATSQAPINDAVTALATTPIVTAAFEFSYRALPAQAARLFRLLGLVPRPTFTRRAASALLGGDPAALDLLDHASLVEHHHRDRYRMHDLLHGYARDLLTPAERADALPRLLDHYLQTTDAASDLVIPEMTRQPRPTAVTFRSTTDATEWLDAELDNIAAVTLTRPPGRTWQLADALRRHLWLAARVDLSLQLYDAGLAMAVAERDLLGQGAMHHAIGTAHMTDDAELAATCFATAASLFEQANAPQSRLSALNNLSRCHSMRGDLTSTLAVLRSTADLVSTPAQHANLCNATAVALGYQGRLTEALHHHEEELRHRGLSDATLTMPSTIMSMAFVTRQLGLLDRCATMIGLAERMAAETGAPLLRMHALATRVALTRDSGRTGDALALNSTLLDLLADAHGAPFEPAAHATQGQLLEHRGLIAAAEESLARALRAAEEMQYGNLVSGMLVDLARVCLARGDHDAARAHASRALEDARARDLPVQQGRALMTLAHLGSWELVGEALVLQQESGYLLGQAEAHLALGEDERAGAIFARFTGQPDHAPAGVLTVRPCRRCTDLR